EVTEPPAPVQDTFNPEEPPPPPPPPETEHIVTLEEVVPINVNTADRELLMLLPDIGEEEADEIIALRDELDGFRNVYELRLVQSISDEQLSRILEYICV
ncbi:MAG: helix-hairpin-helix domain-containing protein, partial [Ruminococcus sp.]|nr:helix-hairpin-helix domain-containing protein [Ruminococcus sp.]